MFPFLNLGLLRSLSLPAAPRGRNIPVVVGVAAGLLTLAVGAPARAQVVVPAPPARSAQAAAVQRVKPLETETTKSGAVRVKFLAAPRAGGVSASPVRGEASETNDGKRKQDPALGVRFVAPRGQEVRRVRPATSATSVTRQSGPVARTMSGGGGGQTSGYGPVNHEMEVDYFTGTKNVQDWGWDTQSPISHVHMWVEGVVNGVFVSTLVNTWPGQGANGINLSFVFDSTHFANNTTVAVVFDGMWVNGSSAVVRLRGKVKNKAYMIANRDPALLVAFTRNAGNARAALEKSNYKLTASRTDRQASIRASLPRYSVFYAATHGSAREIGDCYHYEGGDDSFGYVSGTEIAASLASRPNTEPPYNFVFLSGCHTAGGGRKCGRPSFKLLWYSK